MNCLDPGMFYIRIFFVPAARISSVVHYAAFLRVYVFQQKKSAVDLR